MIDSLIVSSYYFMLYHTLFLTLSICMPSFFRYVLYKERNMLLTELKLSSRSQLIMPQPERLQKVKKSMGAIRHVLGERKQEKLAALALRRAQMEEDEKGRVSADDSTSLTDKDDTD
jgi:hypothetical protein